MVRVYALGTWVDVDLSGSNLDEAEFRRLWGRTLAGPAGDAPFDQAGSFVAEPGSGNAVFEPAQRAGEPGRSKDPVLELSGSSYVSATQAITRALIERRWGELLMLHAGAVADPGTGRTLAYVAPGGTGKSTLTRLLAQELGYVTDETVGIDPETLRVLPYPKPLTWADERGKPKREHAPDDVGLGATPEAPVLARLAVLRRRDGAEASFRQLDLLEAIEMVVPETSSLSKLPRPLELFASVYERVGGVTLIEYGEAEDVVEWCRAALAAPESPRGLSRSGPRNDDSLDTPEPPRWLSRSGPRNEDPDRVETPEAHPPTSILAVDGESVVLTDTQLLRLGPIATAILELWPRPVDELAAALKERFGSPEDGNLIDAVEEQLRELADHGVIKR